MMGLVAKEVILLTMMLLPATGHWRLWLTMQLKKEVQMPWKRGVWCPLLKRERGMSAGRVKYAIRNLGQPRLACASVWLLRPELCVRCLI